MALSTVDLATIDRIISALLTQFEAVIAGGPAMNWSDQGRSVSQADYLAVLTGRIREMRQMKVAPSILWLGTDYRTTAASGVNVLPQPPAWIGDYIN